VEGRFGTQGGRYSAIKRAGFVKISVNVGLGGVPMGGSPPWRLNVNESKLAQGEKGA